VKQKTTKLKQKKINRILASLQIKKKKQNLKKKVLLKRILHQQEQKKTVQSQCWQIIIQNKLKLLGIHGGKRKVFSMLTPIR
jgi:hypothetical protein